ncbi:conjugal transfer protein TraI [Mucilaginibacter sp.]|uniref:conjugal transfer protein TraI n=1 Tax=Mucilaginibacter sp. TaxID=1882438 RepID=UPI0035BC1CE7
MKILKVTLPVSLAIVLVSFNAKKANAQFVVSEVIKLTVTKVIKAIDLKVQRMQNQTIWLQNAQKVLENQLSRLRLTEISDWTSGQRQLYSGYYDELWKVKATIAYYQRIKDLTVKQIALVTEYNRAWNLLKQDKHFSRAELSEMQKVYSGILSASVQNLDQILLVVNPGKTQMSDEQRLELVNHAGNRLDENYSDLHRFNTQNQILSLQRSKETGDTKTTQSLYGIN